MKRVSFFLLLAISACRTSAQPVVIQYTGNMGVLIKQEETQVLIDGLHLPYDKEYLPPSVGLLDSMVQSKGQYKVNVLLFTHQHNDHFNEQPVNAFLRANPESHVLAPAQVISKIDILFKNQLIEADEVPFFKIANNKLVKPLITAHTWPQRHAAIANRAYIVELSGKKILHVGDADCSEEVFEKSGIERMHFDVAIVPSWFFGNTASKLTIKYVHANTYVITHISPVSNPFTERIKANISQLQVKALLFQNLGDSIHID
jgi:L-ascorbate metabolism protein UlaG (beta-lactamase superfamily)